MRTPRTSILAVCGLATFLLAGFSSTARLQTEKDSADKPDTLWVAPPETKKTENPVKGNADATAKGKEKFDQLCFVCHGSDGRGDGVAVQSLDVDPADFGSDKVQDQADGELFWKMTTGRGMMVSYKELLTEEQRWQLVNYVRVLGEDAKKAEEAKKAEKEKKKKKK
jgi:mono/diheme cytochrome c family protein